MKVTVTKLAIRRLLFLIASAVVTAILSWVKSEPSLVAYAPVIYFILTTVRDYLDKSIPNA